MSDHILAQVHCWWALCSRCHSPGCSCRETQQNITLVWLKCPHLVWLHVTVFTSWPAYLSQGMQKVAVSIRYHVSLQIKYFSYRFCTLMSTGTWTLMKQRHHTVAIYLILLMHQFSNWFPPDDEQTDEQAERLKRQTPSVNSKQGRDSAQKSVLHFICRTHWTLNCLLAKSTHPLHIYKAHQWNLNSLAFHFTFSA